MLSPAVLLLLATLQVGQAERPSAIRGFPAFSSANMPGQNVPQTPAAAGPAEAGGDPMANEATRGDARLRDVCFVDPRHGWAVGDRGTIWHTDDGSHWLAQSSGVTCSLTSVSFADEQNGWAAGGYSHPYLHTSSGVVLWTHDGGRQWQHDARLLLPAIRQMRFADDRRGWAVGDASAMFPGGMFVTRDCGRSWLPPCGAGTTGWLTADFYDPAAAGLAGRGGAVFTLEQGELRRARLPGGGLQDIGRLKLVPPRFGWLVGDGGLVLMTADQGRNWQPPPTALPFGCERFDFRALAVRGPKCWIAGTPGTRVFHTADSGHTWAAMPTGTTLPIRAITLVDDQNGWAVGDLGVILATRDGGQSWQRQRAGGGRAAVLALFARPDDLPLELLARLCGDEGYLGVADVLCRRDVELAPREETHPADRTHEALLAVGASGAETAWRFPLRQPGLTPSAAQIAEGWDRANGGRGGEELLNYLVRQIRTWRPDAIVTHDSAAPPDDPLGPRIHQVVLDACRCAADPQFQAETMRPSGLEPWQVRRVYAASPPGMPGEIDVSAAQVSFRLGQTLADMASPARALLFDHRTEGPATLGFRLVGLDDHGPAAQPMPLESRIAGRGHRATAMFISSDPDVRRSLAEGPAENVEILHRVARHRQRSEAILERFEHDPQAAPRLLANLDDLTRGLDARGAARFLYRVGDQYAHSGRWDMAAEVFTTLVDRYRDDPLCRPAIQWLMQYYATGQWPEQTVNVPRQSRVEMAAALGREIERTRPDLFAQPAIRFPLAAAYRRMNQPQQAERLYALDRHGSGRDAWSACAEGELWLTRRSGTPPKPLVACVRAAQRPRLDGRLDDAVWKSAKPAPLASSLGDDAAWPGVVMLAHDDEFLYIGIHCRQAPGVNYESAAGTRTRDADLSGRDRVEILLDPDRSYATYYHLTIDHRGWANDGCFGDATWNPRWFIAAQAGEGTWSAEAAVPLRELLGKTAPPPGKDAVWAIGIQRIVPGLGFQSWSTPAAIAIVPEGFGLLGFEE